MNQRPYAPYNNASRKLFKNTLWWSGAFTIVLMVILRIVDQWLTTPESPGGMVGFELAGNIQETLKMIISWGEHGRIMAGFSLGIDYLYIVSYSLFLGLSAFAIGKKLNSRNNFLSKPGYWFSWLMFIAAFFDGIENYALIRILSGDHDQLWASISFYFASTKFVIVLLTLLYIILGLIAIRITKPAKNQPASQ